MEGSLEEIDLPLGDGLNSGEITAFTERAHHEIETITDDSKLRAFGALLAGFSEQATGSWRVIVLTDFVATLFYLAANIEERGMKSTLLQGGMDFEERTNSLERFAAGEGILVATTAATVGGIDLPKATDLYPL
jgi:superfamily II DNA/RNA helicase